jgi:hypothetical protein
MKTSSIVSFIVLAMAALSVSSPGEDHNKVSSSIINEISG